MECLVCLETKNNFIYFRCAHHVCADCSDRMIEFRHAECPMCRVRIKEPMPEATPEPRVPESRERECLRDFGKGCINECSNDRYVNVAFGCAAIGAVTSCVMGSILQMS